MFSLEILNKKVDTGNKMTMSQPHILTMIFLKHFLLADSLYIFSPAPPDPHLDQQPCSPAMPLTSCMTLDNLFT